MSSTLHERLDAAAGRLSYRRLGELTRTSPETVRRYMQGHAPSVQFLADLCAALGVNGSWLLTGMGPMRASDVRSHALKEADASELLTAIADTLTTLMERVDRLEQYMQQVETRVRAVSTMLETKPEIPPALRAKAHPPTDAARDASANAPTDAPRPQAHTDAGPRDAPLGGRLGQHLDPSRSSDPHRPGGTDAPDRIGRAVTE